MGANAISILGATMRKCVVGLVLLLSSSSVFGQEYGILIRNGRVVDGMGNPWVYADVGVTGDRIRLLRFIQCCNGFAPRDPAQHREDAVKDTPVRQCRDNDTMESGHLPRRQPEAVLSQLIPCRKLGNLS